MNNNSYLRANEDLFTFVSADSGKLCPQLCKSWTHCEGLLEPLILLGLYICVEGTIPIIKNIGHQYLFQHTHLCTHCDEETCANFHASPSCELSSGCEIYVLRYEGPPSSKLFWSVNMSYDSKYTVKIITIHNDVG